MQTYLKTLFALCAVLLLVGGVVSAQEAAPAVSEATEAVEAAENDANNTIIIQRGQSDQLDAVVNVEPGSEAAEPVTEVEAEAQPEGVIDVAETLENEPEEGTVLGIGTLVLLVGLAAIVVVGGAVLMRERLQSGAA